LSRSPNGKNRFFESRLIDQPLLSSNHVAHHTTYRFFLFALFTPFFYSLLTLWLTSNLVLNWRIFHASTAQELRKPIHIQLARRTTRKLIRERGCLRPFEKGGAVGGSSACGFGVCAGNDAALAVVAGQVADFEAHAHLAVLPRVEEE
jgi:hypothetical protein